MNCAAFMSKAASERKHYQVESSLCSICLKSNKGSLYHTPKACRSFAQRCDCGSQPDHHPVLCLQKNLPPQAIQVDCTAALMLIEDDEQQQQQPQPQQQLQQQPPEAIAQQASSHYASVDPGELDIQVAEGLITQQEAFNIEATMQYNAITGMSFMPAQYSEEASQNMNINLNNHQPFIQQQQQFYSRQQQQGALQPMMLQQPMTCSMPAQNRMTPPLSAMALRNATTTVMSNMARQQPMMTNPDVPLHPDVNKPDVPPSLMSTRP